MVTVRRSHRQWPLYEHRSPMSAARCCARDIRVSVSNESHISTAVAVGVLVHQTPHSGARRGDSVHQRERERA